MKIFALILACSVAAFGAQSSNIKDMYFEIHGPILGKALGAEEEGSKPYCKIYWTPKRFEAVAVYEGGSRESREALAAACAGKAAIALPFSLDEYLTGLEKTGSSGQWVIYQDATGVNDKNEVWIKTGKQELGVIEKRPIGTTRLEYSYRDVGGAQKVVKVARRSYEGIQNVVTDTNVKWSKVGQDFVPIQADTRTIWSVAQEDKGTHNREIRETLSFRNYQVNKSKAGNRFTQGR